MGQVEATRAPGARDSGTRDARQGQDVLTSSGGAHELRCAVDFAPPEPSDERTEEKTMATRAEQFHSSAQRSGTPKRISKKKPKKSTWSHDKAHAGSKATHAMEPARAGRPSRESTRGTANRAKADSARNITEEVRQGAPSARARRSQVKSKKVRGSSR
jgi:hypothetical protein